jgi:hypothetical protein
VILQPSTICLHNADISHKLVQCPLTNIRVARLLVLVLNAAQAGSKAGVWPSRQRGAQRSSKRIKEVLQANEQIKRGTAFNSWLDKIS